MMATWKPSAVEPGWYDVCDDGRVRSWNHPSRLPRKVPVPLKPSARRSGPPVVTMIVDRVRQAVSLPRLVLLTFIGPPADPDHIARHRDRDPANNALANLEWGPRWAGDEKGEAVFTAEEAQTVREEYAAGSQACDIAARRGVSHAAVTDVVRGRTYRNAGGETEPPPGGQRRGHQSRMAKLGAGAAAEALAMRERGATWSEIGAALGVGRTTAKRYAISATPSNEGENLHGAIGREE